MLLDIFEKECLRRMNRYAETQKIRKRQKAIIIQCNFAEEKKC